MEGENSQELRYGVISPLFSKSQKFIQSLYETLYKAYTIIGIFFYIQDGFYGKPDAPFR